MFVWITFIDEQIVVEKQHPDNERIIRKKLR